MLLTRSLCFKLHLTNMCKVYCKRSFRARIKLVFITNFSAKNEDNIIL